MATMKAVVADRPGNGDVLRLAEVEKPKPVYGEILVKVAACALNPVDYKIRGGYFSNGRKYPAIYGYDVSGVVEKVAPDVTEFKPGEEVFYCGELAKQGAYAEYHVVSAELVCRKPSNLTHIQAAALPLSGITAWQALFTHTRLKIGETAAIYGAAGGVGSLAVQMARWAGAKVIGICSTANVPIVSELGADYAVDYTKTNVIEEVMKITRGEGADVVFETIGEERMIESFGFVKPFGRIVFLNAFGPGKFLHALNPARLKNAAIYCELMQPSGKTLANIATLAERGFIKPLVESVIGLGEIPAGHKRLKARHGHGKIVVNTAM